MEQETPIMPPAQEMAAAAAPLDQVSMALDGYALVELREAVKWSRFLAIAGIVAMGILTIAGLFMVVFVGQRRDSGSILAIIPMALIIAVYFFPIYYLYQYSTIAKDAIINRDGRRMTQAFSYLKLHYKFMGILFIVIMSLYVVIGIAAVVGINMFKH